MAWRKKMCYVVTAFYREDEELPDQPEVETYLDYKAAEQRKQLFEADPDIKTVYLDEKEQDVWVSGPEELIEQAEDVRNNKTLNDHQKDVLLADIMTGMERTYHIPAIKTPEWEAKHKDVIDAYRRISSMRCWDSE